jgi:hypothetical protein
LLSPQTVCQCYDMNTPPASQAYKNHRFPVEIISHAVWLYFPSLADVGTAVNKLTMPSLLIKYCILLFEKSQYFLLY